MNNQYQELQKMLIQQQVAQLSRQLLQQNGGGMGMNCRSGTQGGMGGPNKNDMRMSDLGGNSMMTNQQFAAQQMQLQLGKSQSLLGTTGRRDSMNQFGQGGNNALLVQQQKMLQDLTHQIASQGGAGGAGGNLMAGDRRSSANNMMNAQQLMMQPQRGSANNTFLDGTFNGGWQSPNDIPDRRRVIYSICKMIKQMRPDDARQMSQKLPFMAKRLEVHLYRSAQTKEEYLDPNTLKKRLQLIAHGLEMHRSPSSSGSSGNKSQKPGDLRSSSKGNSESSRSRNSNISNPLSALSAGGMGGSRNDSLLGESQPSAQQLVEIQQALQKHALLRQIQEQQAQLLEQQRQLQQRQQHVMPQTQQGQQLQQQQVLLQKLQQQFQQQQLMLQQELICQSNRGSNVEATQTLQQEMEEEIELNNVNAEDQSKEDYKITELESTVSQLEAQLEETQAEATAAIDQWQSHATTLEEEKEDTQGTPDSLRDELEQAKELLKDKEAEFDAAMAEETKARKAAEEAAGSFDDQINDIAKESEDVVSQWQARVEELENAVADLEIQLDQQQEVASAAIAQCEEVSKGRQEHIASFHLHESLEGRKAAFNVLNQEVKNLADATAEKQMETDRVNNDLKDANSRLRKFEQEIAFEKNERRMLEAHTGILSLEDELRKCHESSQVYVTNEISKRATEMATESLREEVAELRCKIVEDRKALQMEQKARKSALKEVDRLQADLALVLRVEMRDGNMDEQIKSMVMKTANNVQQKERAEIDELRQSLERTLRELEQAKATERDASERAASAELQVSACEQEIVATKAKVETLTRTLEEARKAEEARVASFEYRVSALEDDRDVLRRMHADELETMRNELSLIAMEKDRILQSLRESEKTNAALVFEASNKQDDSSLPIQAREVAKLRAANAQLLAAVTQEAAGTERRIREAVAASGSSSEADIIFERGLRTAAEMALEIAKEELQEARKRAEGIEPKSPLTKNIAEEKLATQLKHSLIHCVIIIKHSRAESTKLKDEIDSLKAELDKERQESQITIDALTEECRQAQSAALKLERESHYETEISTEMIKSLANYEETPEQEEQQNWVVVNEDPANSVVSPKSYTW